MVPAGVPVATMPDVIACGPLVGSPPAVARRRELLVERSAEALRAGSRDIPSRDPRIDQRWWVELRGP